MPLIITTKDITTIECDAIVNPTRSFGLIYGNPCERIHKIAGRKLHRACLKQYRINKPAFSVGETLVTEAYKLPSKNVIHLLKPAYVDNVEIRNYCLRSCYKNIFRIVKNNHYLSIAIPLIAEDDEEFSRYEISKIAIDEIKNFLLDTEALVYLVVNDRANIQIGESWRDELVGYVHEKLFNDSSLWDKWENTEYACEAIDVLERKLQEPFLLAQCKRPISVESIVDMLKNMDDNFAVTLLKLIDKKNMNDIECYKKANVSRQTWYKIMNDKNYKPSKYTIIAFAIALKLSLDETNALLATAGYILSNSDKYDIIISYCISTKEYDIFAINEMLFEFDLPLLGV